VIQEADIDRLNSKRKGEKQKFEKVQKLTMNDEENLQGEKCCFV